MKENTMAHVLRGLGAIVLLLPALGLAQGKAPAPPPGNDEGFEAKTFVGELKDPSGKVDKDEFVFHHGTFRSTACDAWGFKAEPYEVELDAKGLRFTCKAESAKEGTMEWSGKATGDVLEGTATWTKDGKATVYTFKGTLKK
jgi:hypothetical protein